MASSMFVGTGGPVNTVSTGVDPLTDTAELWTRRKSASEELKEQHQGNWLRYWRWYMNWIKALEDPQDWWRANAPDPQAFKVIETVLPKALLGRWLAQRPFGIKGRERNDAAGSLKIESLLLYMLEVNNLFKKDFESKKYTSIVGHSTGKMVWKTEVENFVRNTAEPFINFETGQIEFRPVRVVEPRTMFDDPEYSWLMNDRYWPDPTGEERWGLEKIDTTLEQLEETNEKFFNAGLEPPYTNLSQLADAGNRPSLEPFDETQDAFGISRSHVEPSQVEGTKVELLQCWGWVPRNIRNGGSAHRLTVIANGLIEIRDKDIPTPDQKIPYFPQKSIPIPGRYYGESILRWIGPQIDIKSRLGNMRADEASLGVWQQFVYDREAVTNNQMLMEPGGGIPIDTQGGRFSVSDAFSVIPRKPMMNEVYIEDQARAVTIEQTSAATPEQQGAAHSSRQTALEVSTLANRGDQRFIIAAMWSDQTIFKEILERGFKLYQQQLPPGRLVRIVGTDEDAEIDISELQLHVDIEVQASINAFNREAQTQSVAELMQLLSNETLAPWLKARELIETLVENRGWTDPNKFVKTEEEFAQEQQQNIQQQVQMAQLEKALEAQTAIAIEQAKGQGQQQIQQGELQLKAAETGLTMQLKQREAELKQVLQEIEVRGAEQQLVFQAQKLAQELAFLREKAAVQIETARLQAKSAATAQRSKAS